MTLPLQFLSGALFLSGLVGVGEEARQTADAQTARYNGDRAENADCGIDERVDKARARVGESARELRLKADNVQLLVVFVKALECAFLK